MEKETTKIPGAWIIQNDVFRDDRGSFMETFSYKKLGQLGIYGSSLLMQGNESASKRLVLRGLHYQLQNPQAKLCWVACGSALDVIVDIRVGSPTYGTVVMVPLAAGSGRAVFVPRGCAHAFLSLADGTVFQYLCDDYYAPHDQRGIIWNDPTLAIDWKTTSPILSPKDAALPTLAQAREQGLLPQYK